MEYYRYLYLSERLEKKKDRIMDRLERNRFQPGIHLILLPANEKNQLEILNAAWLLQPDYPKEGLFVVGIADSFENALEYVEKISQEVYDNTGNMNIRSYILRKEQEG